MEQSTKPIIKLEDVWCTNPPAPGDIAEPDSIKRAQGWVYGEIPRHSTFNWSGNLATSYIYRQNLLGLPEWDSNTTYSEGAYVVDTEYDTTDPQNPVVVERRMFIANKQNANVKPLLDTTGVWREYADSLAELKDVEFNNLQNGDIFQYFGLDPFVFDPTLQVPENLWKNVNSSSFMRITDIWDVIVKPRSVINGSVLGWYENSQDAGWIPMPSSSILRFMELNDFNDVTSTATNYDVLTYSSGEWTGKTFDGFVEWNDIFYKPGTFNPPLASASTIGGFRAYIAPGTFDELYIYTTPLDIPGAPTGFDASDDKNTDIELNWTSPAGTITPEGYNIYRNGELLASVDSSTTRYFDTTAVLFETYNYYVRSYNSNGESIDSNHDLGTRTQSPDIPQNFSASDGESSTFIICRWTDVPGAISYDLYRRPESSTDENDFILVANGIQSPFAYRVEPETTYSFAIKAVNTVGESNFSIPDIGSSAANYGEKVFEMPGNFIVPNGIWEVEVFVQAGGGAGSIGDEDGYPSGGGFAGEYKYQKVQVQPGYLLAVTEVGSGGVNPQFDLVTDGNAGTDSAVEIEGFGTVRAKGGRGGMYNTKDYRGDGGERISTYSGEVYLDGLHSFRPDWISCYGGQASEFGNGGSRSGQIAGYGAGGTAISNREEQYDNPAWNKGGNGIVVIRYGIVEEVENITDEELADMIELNRNANILIR